MKRFLPFLLLASCNTHDPVRLVCKDGTEVNLGKATNFASQSYVNVGFDKYGHPRMTTRDNSEAVPIHALDVAGTAYGMGVWGAVEKAATASETALGLGAQKAAVAGQEIATRVPLAEVATKVPLAEIAAGTPAATAVKASKKLFKK